MYAKAHRKKKATEDDDDEPDSRPRGKKKKTKKKIKEVRRTWKDKGEWIVLVSVRVRGS
jgi:hypothetical protein